MSGCGPSRTSRARHVMSVCGGRADIRMVLPVRIQRATPPLPTAKPMNKRAPVDRRLLISHAYESTPTCPEAAPYQRELRARQQGDGKPPPHHWLVRQGHAREGHPGARGSRRKSRRNADIAKPEAKIFRATF